MFDVPIATTVDLTDAGRATVARLVRRERIQLYTLVGFAIAGIMAFATWQLGIVDALVATVASAVVFLLLPFSGEGERVADLRADSCLRARGAIRSYAYRSWSRYATSFEKTYLVIDGRVTRAVYNTTWGPLGIGVPNIDIASGTVDYTAGRKYVLDIRDEHGWVLFRQTGYKPAG